jgi:hypothetical protein
LERKYGERVGKEREGGCLAGYDIGKREGEKGVKRSRSLLICYIMKFVWRRRRRRREERTKGRGVGESGKKLTKESNEIEVREREFFLKKEGMACCLILKGPKSP